MIGVIFKDCFIIKIQLKFMTHNCGWEFYLFLHRLHCQKLFDLNKVCEFE